MTVSGHLVALLGLPGLGPARLRHLLDAFPDPADAWSAVRAGRLADVDLRVGAERHAALVARWRSAAADSDVDAIVERHRSAGISVITPEHPWWPDSFRHDPEPPPLAFVAGDAGLLAGVSVAVVGTRRCTAAGRSLARDLGADLATAGVAVVSGLALGIDGEAHVGARRVGGTCIGVVATGLDVVYPRRHAGLWADVATSGVLLSEAPLGTPAERWRFPARNRLIAALASVVVVVESGLRGGSMLTVESAIRRQTDVMAVPGPVRAPTSAGPNQLLADGCGVVRDAADVLAALGSSAPVAGTTARAGAVSPGRPGSDDPVEAAVSWPAMTLDEVVAATGLPFAEVASRLTTLEIAGRVERVADGYQRTVS